MNSTLTKKIIYFICNERKGEWIYFEDIIKNINPEYFSNTYVSGKNIKDALVWTIADSAKQASILNNFEKTLDELIKKDIIEEKLVESKPDYVPTIIFYRDGLEIGRFVEFAQVSLEKDILAIVSGVGYKHSYED